MDEQNQLRWDHFLWRIVSRGRLRDTGTHGMSFRRHTEDYWSKSMKDQWEEDKRLGLLDWDGT
jgi:hypothetical protein